MIMLSKSKLKTSLRGMKSYEEQLRELEMSMLGKRREQRDKIAFFKYLKEIHR